MKVLFDHNVDRRFRRHLPTHEVTTTREMGWEQLANGKLLQAAAGAGFDVFVSIDKNLQYEQNLNALPIAIVVLDAPSNALPALLPFAGHVLRLLDMPLKTVLYVLRPDGSFACHGTPSRSKP